MSCLTLSACNKRSNPTAVVGPTVAPPIAALPLAGTSPAPASPAPLENALPRPQRLVAYAPPPPAERYRYLDRAYALGDAFAGTPPDYAVDYGGSRPWVWRARNGAYRIVERLPHGERVYYYDAGEARPFLIRDPEYSYAYRDGELAGIYDSQGALLRGAGTSRYTDVASRYLDRSEALYDAAQHQQRRSAYASEWAVRRQELWGEHQRWQHEQARNTEWRAWHDAHRDETSSEWQGERDQRLAYARAVGIPIAPSQPLPKPDYIVRRQAAYFAARQPAQQSVLANRVAPSSVAAASVSAVGRKPSGRSMPVILAAQSQSKLARAAQPGRVPPQENTAAQTIAAQQKAAAAKARLAQAAEAQRAAAEAQKKAADNAQAKAAQAASAQLAAAEAMKKQAAAAQLKVGELAKAQKVAAQAKQREALAGQAKARQLAQAQTAAAQAKQKDEATAKAKAAKAAEAQKIAAEVRQKAELAAQAKARQAAAETVKRQAAAAQAKSEEAARARKAAADARQLQIAAARAQAKQAAAAQKASADARQKEAHASPRKHEPQTDHEAHGA